MRELFNQLFKEVYGVTFANTARHDPYKDFAFEVVITGAQNFAKFGFSKASGLKGDIDVIEYREGGDNFTAHKSPGQTKYDPITLERGMSEDADSWNWFTQVFNLSGMGGQVAEPNFKGTMQVKLKDRDGSIVRTWECVECWPSSYDVGDLDASGNGVLIERLVIQHEGFTVK